MKINTINYFIIDALKSIKRNKTISVASMITVLITFFIFGTFTLMALNFNRAIEDVAEGVEIQVYLLDDIMLVNQREIEITLREQPGVKDVVYESKDEAFLRLKESLAENEGLLQGYDLSNNPLPSSFIVKLSDASYAENIGTAVEGLTGVESIKNQQDLINTISSVVKVLQIIGIGLFVIFIGVSVFLIMNTIKITVYSRRREVGIMKFVGATDWFIRWPFIIEGIIIGAIGSIMSIVVLYFSYKAVFEWIVSSMYITTIIQPQLILSTLLWMFLGGGILVGAIGSIAALRKFLVV